MRDCFLDLLPPRMGDQSLRTYWAVASGNSELMTV
jgi:hypothetical protein